MRRRAGLFLVADPLKPESAEAVAGADLDTLQSLVDKSLVRRTAGRYWMLETIREFAAEALEASSCHGTAVTITSCPACTSNRVSSHAL